MFKKILNKIKSWFNPNPPPIPSRTQPKVRIGDEVGNVTISKQWQLDKHTDFKVGESYRVGEMIVTLRASKAEVAKVLAEYEAKRLAKEAKLRERAIDIMLMTPEQLMELKVNEWLDKRIVKMSVIERIMGKFMGERYIAPRELISGKPEDRFKALMKEIKEKEKVP